MNERRRLSGQQKVSGVTWRRTLAVGCQILAAGQRTRRRHRPSPASGPGRFGPNERTPPTRSVKGWLLLTAVALLSGCAAFNKPPLPQFTTGEAPPPAPDPWSASLGQVDLVYCRLTKTSAAENEAAWRVVETFQARGAQVALGWSELPAAQQPILEQWRRQEISAEQLLQELGAPRGEDWLRRALRPDLLQVALGAPRQLLYKLRTGEALDAAELALLPRDYRPRPDAFETFANRIVSFPRLRRYAPTDLYRAHLAAEQIMAENIVTFRRANPNARLLVFLPNDPLIDPREVAALWLRKVPCAR